MAEESEHPEGDETRPLPAADETQSVPVADETQQIPAGDETTKIPATPEQPWSGRAGVPPPAATPLRGPTPYDWEPADEGAGRRWWLPIVLGIVALLLLGVLAVGIWLIVRAEETEPSTPTPSPTLAPTSAPATSAAPTTGPPPTTAAATVPVPPLVGLTQNQARAALEELGLGYRLVFRQSTQPAGTVIETDPAAGVAVPEGTEVTIVIATVPPTSAPPTSAAPATTAAEPTPTQ
ncbi:PASTA domain-containing protein [Phytohabitans rumicis]|uniref:PASTA domain-containing protein n=1 Tax=Phytohabitans rumicis TaxID=1076125 RepID=A0A6V8LCY3_9ACTN|nr:PASTA domain-containing protein [Phytohabitans rumicis]GFJ90535.1 hypothetical protein Prum_041770 [Phytohabitans rumicis]